MTIKDREYYNYEGVDMGASFSSPTIDMIRFKGYFVQVVTTGSPVGTFYMYSSNDPTLATVTNWKEIPYSTMVVNGADVHMYNQDGLYCRYVKLGYTRKSQAVVNILSVGASVKHAQPVEILIFKNATLAGTPNFQAYSSISCTDWDTASTTATISDNSQILWSGQLGETGNFLFSFSDQIRIFPGDVISVVAKATTGTPAYVSASLNTREDI